MFALFTGKGVVDLGLWLAVHGEALGPPGRACARALAVLARAPTPAAPPALHAAAAPPARAEPRARAGRLGGGGRSSAAGAPADGSAPAAAAASAPAAPWREQDALGHALRHEVLEVTLKVQWSPDAHASRAARGRCGAAAPRRGARAREAH